jgi:DNA-binding transcriptional MerR regulator
MGEWTLEELVRRAGQVLAAADVRAPNGRVTELPDARVVRWYTTRGIVDRPSGNRGRTALYGPRHLLQLVAVKRLQARGLSLAEIQGLLAGATDTELRRRADLPTDVPHSDTDTDNDTADASHESEPVRARFWTEPPAQPNGDGVLHGVALADGVLLLVPAAPSLDDLAAIRVASAPLIEILSRRGLLARPNR